MIAIRQLATCAALSPGPDHDIPARPGKLSVLQAVFGLSQSPGSLSVLERARQLVRKHVDLNLIYVGRDHLTDALKERMVLALAMMRVFYARVDLGVGIVDDYFIPASESDGDEIILSDAEADALTQEWTFPNNAVDVFIVLEFLGATVGLSPLFGGVCDKKRKDTMTGCVVALEGSIDITGLTLAHEVGHYLGLDHTKDPDNLMFETLPNGGRLENWQGEEMKKHCFIKTGCRGN